MQINLAGTAAGEQLGLQVIQGGGQTISVRVRGKLYEIGNLSADDFVATASLDGVVQAGTYDLNVHVVSKNPSIQLESISASPSVITASFDKIVSKDFTLTAEAPKATPAAGFIMQPLECSPTKVTITGPEASINQIDHCVVSAALEGELNEPHTTTGELVMFDKDGRRIVNDKLSADTTSFTVNIPVYMKKTLPLKVEFRNVPSGFPLDELDYHLSSDTIDLAAPSDSISGLGEFTLGTIDLRNVNIGSVFNLEVQLPNNYRDLSNLGSVQVTFPTEDMASKSFDVARFSITNAPENYNIRILDSALKNITIIGPTDVISELTPLDISVEVNLLDINVYEGTQSVPAEVSVPDKGLVWAYGPYNLTIEATKK